MGNHSLHTENCTTNYEWTCLNFDWVQIVTIFVKLFAEHYIYIKKENTARKSKNLFSILFFKKHPQEPV